MPGETPVRGKTGYCLAENVLNLPIWEKRGTYIGHINSRKHWAPSWNLKKRWLQGGSFDPKAKVVGVDGEVETREVVGVDGDGKTTVSTREVVGVDGDGKTKTSTVLFRVICFPTDFFPCGGGSSCVEVVYRLEDKHAQQMRPSHDQKS